MHLHKSAHMNAHTPFVPLDSYRGVGMEQHFSISYLSCSTLAGQGVQLQHNRATCTECDIYLDMTECVSQVQIHLITADST